MFARSRGVKFYNFETSLLYIDFTISKVHEFIIQPSYIGDYGQQWIYALRVCSMLWLLYRSIDISIISSFHSFLTFAVTVKKFPLILRLRTFSTKWKLYLNTLNHLRLHSEWRNRYPFPDGRRPMISYALKDFFLLLLSIN